MSGEIGPTPKQDYWEQIVLPTIPGLVAGTYVNPEITVGDNGLVRSIADGVVHLATVENVSSLSTISSPDAGTIAVVLDDGMGNIVLYGYNLSPSPGWYQVTFPPALGAASTSFTHTSSSGLLCATVLPNTLWKRLVVTIKTPFTAGTGFSLVDSTAVTWMDSSLINAQAPGTYEYEILGNDTVCGLGTQLFLSRTGSPSAGTGVVYVEYVTNN